MSHSTFMNRVGSDVSPAIRRQERPMKVCVGCGVPIPSRGNRKRCGPCADEKYIENHRKNAKDRREAKKMNGEVNV